MDGSSSDDSEIKEKRAGGGPDPTGGRPEQEDRGGGSGPTTSIRNAGGAFTYRMTAETLLVRADIACVTDICTLGRYDHAEVVLTLLRSIGFQSYAVESQARKANKRDSNFRCCIQL